jgi:hypothetical protein
MYNPHFLLGSHLTQIPPPPLPLPSPSLYCSLHLSPLSFAFSDYLYFPP